MKSLAVVCLSVAAACTPDLPKTAPQDHAFVAFNPGASPPVVPGPNDLALDPATGKVNAPIDPSASAAAQEFTRDYLNTLDGFPAGSVASALIEGGDLDPATVTRQSVLVTDLTAAATGGSGLVPGAAPQYEAATHELLVLPPGGAWIKGHKYAVAVVSGPGQGVQAAGGGQVYGSAAWTLARSTRPLVDCVGAACRSTTSLISDPAQAQALEQLRKGYAPLLDALAARAIARENVAALWTFTITTQPEMRFDPAGGVVPFPNNLLTRAVDGGVQVNLPLPDGGVLPDGGLTPQAQLIAGLNTLDGFSTTAPIVSENSDTFAALTDEAGIDPATVSAQTAGVVPLVDPGTLPPQNVAPCVLPDMPGCASSSAQADGGYAPLPDGGTLPQQLQFVPVAPLEGHTPYGVFVTTNVKAKGGKSVAPTSAFALFRLANPLLDNANHSTIPAVPDAQAQQIEPARLALKPFFDALEARGIHRKDLALAWNFTTESTVSVLQALHGFPAAAALPTSPITLANADAQFVNCPGGCPYPTTGIGHVLSGTLLNGLLLTGPSGTLNPAKPAVRPIPFLLVLPSGAPPSGGWPVVMFGHGLAGHRLQALAFASALNQGGFAVLSADQVWHNDRSSCTGVYEFLLATGQAPPVPANTPAGAKDSLACASPALTLGTQVCDEGVPVGRCVAATGSGNACTYLSNTAATDGSGGDLYCQGVSQGACKPTATGQPGASTCEGGDFARDANGVVRISGWNIFNASNLFVTRDNLRQQVSDDAQQARLLAASDATSLNGQLNAAFGTSGVAWLNGARLDYAGLSLGAMTGTLYTAVAPEVNRSLLNVPTGDLMRVFLTSPNPSLAQLRTAFLAQLHAQGIDPATPAFDTFLGLAKMILDPADMVNAGWSTLHGQGAPAGREVFFQWIENDQLLPNPTTQELIAATLRGVAANSCSATSPAAPCAQGFEFTDAQFCANGLAAADCLMPQDANDRHGFLLNGVPSSRNPGVLSGLAQQQAVQFLFSGTLKTTFP